MPDLHPTKAQAAMLSLAAGALFDAPVQLPPDTDFEALFTAVREQALPGVLSEGLTSLQEDAVPLAVMQRWQSHVVAILQKNAALLQAQSDLLSLCRERGIPALILKGFSAAVYYPVPDLRACGDVDCLIPPQRLNELCLALEEGGFEREPGLDEHHVAYHKDGVMLEIHFKVSGLPEGEVGELLQGKFFADIFDKATEAQVLGERFPVPAPHHQAMILLLHIAKHLQDGGVGLRQVLDLALFAKHHQTVFDFDFIHLLRTCGLYRFTETLLLGCTRHLGLPTALVPWCLEGDSDLADALFADFLTGGNFGRAEQTYAGSGMAHKGRRRGESAFAAAVRGVCDMCRLEWPACRKFPPLLLILVPFWILRRLLDRSKPRVRPVKMLRSAEARATLYDELAFFAPDAPKDGASIDKTQFQ